MSGTRTLLVTLLIGAIALSCVACGSSGAESRPAAMRKPENRLQQCPKNAPGRRDNENPRAKKTLVPPGSSSALVCRYRGQRTAGPTPPPETEVVHAGSGRFSRLLHAFGQLEPVRRGVVACPAGRPLRYLVVFHYKKESDNYVRVDLSGCGLVTNDAFKTLFYPDGKLLRLLRR